ncbi:MAG: 4-(cytidine 5'-diphospho)-2-C-methyl-D-erythritol kinase [Alphaproteobacteria bacterium]|nr:4-(cytidine 5'-diphospho)-2-C-methyl-D-erythritol kinase [Alphaproteobacteria bacterium]
MTTLRDTAFAKINLTLAVHGRRADGFHEIESLIAFAALGDDVTLEPGEALDLAVEGPFAGALAGDNLVIAAAQAAKALHPELRLGRFRLVKNLPVAAGLGGGSAAAAAALRLLARANRGALSETALASLAPELGSDVAVCLDSRPAMITGRGERVKPVADFPSCGVLLANPGVPLATQDVYAALGAEPLAAAADVEAPNFDGDFARLMDYVASRGNALQAPATRLVPKIEDVLAALSRLDGARIARLTGSGPTCFALFSTEDEAKRAAASLTRQHPDWWIAASSLQPRTGG